MTESSVMVSGAKGCLNMPAIRIGMFLLAGVALCAQQPAFTGDAVRGKALFEGQGQCQTCHRVNGNGSRMGPDLSTIGVARRGGGPGGSAEGAAGGNAKALEQSILDPDAEIAQVNRYVRVVTKDGAAIIGRLLNQDNFTVQFIDAQGKLRGFVKSDLRESALLTKSQMPAYQGKLAAQEVADLVAYLLALKGIEQQ